MHRTWNFKQRIWKKNLFRWLHCLGTALITEYSTGFSQWNTMKLDFYTVGVLPKKLMLRQGPLQIWTEQFTQFCFWKLHQEGGLRNSLWVDTLDHDPLWSLKVHINIFLVWSKTSLILSPLEVGHWAAQTLTFFDKLQSRKDLFHKKFLT